MCVDLSPANRASTSLRARVSVHAICKFSIYVDLCRFQFNGTVEGLHHFEAETCHTCMHRALQTKIIGSGLIKV
jgi:hypothetical protein